ncbi:hypothetical protein Pla52n_39940 [Stieleria varia]|uniref:Uncharacterized protein n=1 Tax=Stieleria varia TaxID=2528005 RepID=A0A5C6AV05_9BACT|nr:hypothetical protein Pla52n_39940 [Stieleria varia]
MKAQSDAAEGDAQTNFRGRMEPIYPDDHDESRDWTGPAQKIADRVTRKSGRGTLVEILSSRTEKLTSQ